MRLSPNDFPLTTVGAVIYGKRNSSPLLTAATPEIAGLVCVLLNERHALQEMFVQEGGFPLAVVFDQSGMQVAATH